MHPSFRITHERRNHSFELAGGTLLCALLAGACGGAFSERAPVQHRAGPAASYGAYSTFTPQDLVHAGTRATPAAYTRRPPNIDAYLAANRVRGARAAAVPARRPAASPSRPTASPAATSTLVASITPSARLTPTPAQPATSDLERYAARENNASKQMQYRGGDVIVITASTLIIILLVVILVLLLT